MSYNPRTLIIAGNWKMNNDRDSSISLINEISIEIERLLKNSVPAKNSVQITLSPSFPFLLSTKQTLEENSTLKDLYPSAMRKNNQSKYPLPLGVTSISLAAQNMYFAGNGAFTGEVSASMLLSVGCEQVILGHSERRLYFKETDEEIGKKVSLALEKGLQPILCVGETLAEREEGKVEKVLLTQLQGGLAKITKENWQNIIVAYEPVWAIGTGKVATPETAVAAHRSIQMLLQKIAGQKIELPPILYGGSLKASNAASLLSHPEISGGLIGGASLQAKEFVSIIETALYATSSMNKDDN